MMTLAASLKRTNILREKAAQTGREIQSPVKVGDLVEIRDTHRGRTPDNYHTPERWLPAIVTEIGVTSFWPSPGGHATEVRVRVPKVGGGWRHERWMTFHHINPEANGVRLPLPNAARKLNGGPRIGKGWRAGRSY